MENADYKGRKTMDYGTAAHKYSTMLSQTGLSLSQKTSLEKTVISLNWLEALPGSYISEQEISIFEDLNGVYLVAVAVGKAKEEGLGNEAYHKQEIASRLVHAVESELAKPKPIHKPESTLWNQLFCQNFVKKRYR